MAIVRVETLPLSWGGPRSAWVRLWDDAGRYGLGEASPMDGGTAALHIVDAVFAPELHGVDPLEHGVVQDRLLYRHAKLGPGGAFAAAMAAVDVALWDLKGKILGQPIWKLLGGAWRTELPFYASIGGNAARTPDEVCRIVEGWLPLQPAMVKIRLDGDRTRRDADVSGDIARLRAVRRLLGDGFPLAFDANNAYSVQGALRVGRAMEDLGCVWFEEPVPHDHLESFAKVARALSIPVAAGEQAYTLQEVQQLIAAGVGILQPDIVKTGGFTGLAQMAALARSHGVDLVPHQTQPVIGHTANLHLTATLLHAHYPCEYADRSGVQDTAFVQPVRPEGGRFRLPEAPGLGLEVVEAELQRHRRP
jgi:L-alanine-DL-glutamate epimerase-like enolase superfamily enzyme